MAPYSYSVDSEMTNEMSISTVEPILFGVRTSIDDHVSQDPINIEGVELDLLSFDYFDGSTNAWDMPSENVNPSEQNEVDLTEQFTTDLVFESCNDLLTWARDTGKECGCIVVIKKSDYAHSGRTPRLLLACERPEDRWKVSVDCGRHNHSLATYLEGHSYAGRLTNAERQVSFEMTKNGAKAKQQIYNHRAKLRRDERSGRSQMQYLMDILDKNQYYEWNRREKDTDVVTDLFWAHPKSIKLVNCFPFVLIMDSTYKINRYRWPLFEVVGVTSTIKTFSVCFALFEKEKEDNYLWALERLHSLLNNETLPSVIVTDREFALMNSVEKIFPNANRMLCRWHIQRNILAKGRKLLPDEDIWKSFYDDWNKVMMSNTVDDYNFHFEALERDYLDFTNLLDYIKKTWLPHRELFVSAWIDRYMHLGCTTTGRVESAHAKLKRYMGYMSTSDFVGLWQSMHLMITEQLTKIYASFERSLNNVRHDFRLLTLAELGVLFPKMLWR